MKNKLTIAAGVAIMAIAGITATLVEKEDKTSDLFKANVEALATMEGVIGHCSESYNSCLAVCNKCGGLWEGPGKKGPSYNVTGTCQCGEQNNFKTGGSY